MGYKIIYGTEKKRDCHLFRFLVMTASFSALFLLLLQYFFPEAAELLRRFVIPDALETFALVLGSGDEVGQAVSAFCQELTNGQ